MAQRGLLSWGLDPHAHPMVTESEKAFVVSCLEVLGERCSRAGAAGITSLLGPQPTGAPPLSPRAAFCRALQEVLQDRVRTGADSVFVEPGYLMSLGGKKIVKLWLSCVGSETSLSVCWDWSVKLEPKSP